MKPDKVLCCMILLVFMERSRGEREKKMVLPQTNIARPAARPRIPPATQAIEGYRGLQPRSQGFSPLPPLSLGG